MIRLQNYIDDELKELCDESSAVHHEYSCAKIRDKLNSVQDQLALSSRNVRLYPRHWKSAGNQRGTSSTGALNGSGNTTGFAVATFNTLARGLSCGPNSLFPTPFDHDEKFDGSYGGFTHLSQPELVLDYKLRKWRLLHVLLGGGLKEYHLDGSYAQKKAMDPPFDILALQEVDDYYSFWHPLLVLGDSTLNQDACAISGIKKYQGVFQPKPCSPCVRFGWYSDGVALLWNTEKFHTITKPDDCNLDATTNTCETSDYWIDMSSFKGDAPYNNISINDPSRKSARNQVYIIVPLQRVGTDQIVIVAATHLKAKKGCTNERIRQLQALELKSRVNQMADTLESRGWKNVNVVILGDFNSEPGDSSVQCILQQDGKSHWNMQSAYNLQDKQLYTTYKARKDGTVCRIIDYIFYSNSLGQHNTKETSHQLQCNAILTVPEKEMVAELLPGFRYPSDHVLIAAKFEWA